MTSHDEAMRVVPYDEASRLLQMAYIAGTKGTGYNDAAEKLYEASEAARAQAASGETVDYVETLNGLSEALLDDDGPSSSYVAAQLSELAATFAQPTPSVSVEALEGLCEEWENMTVPRSASSYELGEFDGYRDARHDLCALIAASKKV